VISSESGESKVLKMQGSTFFRVVDLHLYPFSNNLLNVLDAMDLRSIAGARILKVLIITREVRSSAHLIVLYVGGSRDKRQLRGSRRHLYPLIPSGFRLPKDLDLSDKLILDAGHCVSL